MNAQSEVRQRISGGRSLADVLVAGEASLIFVAGLTSPKFQWRAEPDNASVAGKVSPNH